jgi:hypothetical protein
LAPGEGQQREEEGGEGEEGHGSRGERREDKGGGNCSAEQWLWQGSSVPNFKSKFKLPCTCVLRSLTFIEGAPRGRLRVWHKLEFLIDMSTSFASDRYSSFCSSPSVSGTGLDSLRAHRYTPWDVAVGF